MFFSRIPQNSTHYSQFSYSCAVQVATYYYSLKLILLCQWLVANGVHNIIHIASW